MRVFTAPGQSTDTPMLVPSRSCSSASLSATTANFVIEYGPRRYSRLTWKPPMEAVFTTWPPSPCRRTRGRKWRMPLITPRTLTPMIQSHSRSSTDSRVRPPSSTPALLNTRCTLPSSDSNSAAAARTASRSETSSRLACARTPNAATSLCALSRAVASMSASTTLAPALASERAIPSPMPEAAPVTIAPFPFSSRVPTASSGGSAVSQDQRIRAPLHLDIAPPGVFLQFLQQRQQGRGGVAVLPRRPRGVHRLDLALAPHDVAQQEFLVRNPRPAESIAQLPERNVHHFSRGQLPGPLRAEQPVLQIRVHPGIARVFPIDPLGEQDQLVDDVLVALAQGYVDGRLGDHELGMRGDHDRVTQLLSHLHRLLQHFVQPVSQAHFGQLVFQIGDDSSGNLMNVLRVVVFQRRADRQMLAPGDR